MSVRFSPWLVALLFLNGWALAQPVAQPEAGAQPGVQPAAQPAVQPAAQPSAQPAPGSGAPPAVPSGGQPAAQPVAKPTAEVEVRALLKAPRVAESGLFQAEADANRLRALLKANPALANQPLMELRGERASTPLLEAVKIGNAEAVKVLLEAGAKPNVTLSSQASSPLLTAIGARHSGLTRLTEIRLLVGAGATPTGALHVWAGVTNWTDRKTYFGAADALVAAKAGIGTVNETGATPLHVAVLSDNVLAVEKLVALGAPVDDMAKDFAYAGAGTAEGKLILKALKLPETRQL